MLKALLEAILNINVEICVTKTLKEDSINNRFLLTGVVKLEDGSKRVFDFNLTKDDIEVKNYAKRIIELIALGLKIKEEDSSIEFPCCEIVLTTGKRRDVNSEQSYTRCEMVSQTDPSICAEAYFLELEPVDVSAAKSTAIEIWCGLFCYYIEVYGIEKIDVLFSLDLDWDSIFGIYQCILDEQIQSKSLMS